MNEQIPNRVRIYSHITKSRFLHVEDTLHIGKLRLFAGTYRQGQGMAAHAHHFVDMPDARVIFGALARAEQGFKHIEYKGTPPHNGKGAVSRVLSVAIKGDTVYIELKTGPGKLTATGAITPSGKPDVEVNIGFKLYEARRLAGTVLAYIHAWDVLRMMNNRQVVSQPSPYLLVPVSSGTNSSQSAPVRPAQVEPAHPAHNGRPVTNKSPTTNGKLLVPSAAVNNAENETAVIMMDRLRYSDGSLVDADNMTETNTFQRYVKDQKEVPASKDVLLEYYRLRV